MGAYIGNGAILTSAHAAETLRLQFSSIQTGVAIFTVNVAWCDFGAGKSIGCTESRMSPISPPSKAIVASIFELRQ